MRTQFGWTLALAAASAVVLAAASGAALAQGGEARADSKAPSPDPRNLEGVWFITHASHLNRDQSVGYGRESPDKELTHSRVLWPIDHKSPPFTAWGQKEFNAHFNGNLHNQPIADPSTNCIPHGMPRIMISPYPMQIVQSKGLITMLFEVNHNIRLIHMGQPLPQKVSLTQNGYAVGHWDGDTLVIETTGISKSGIFDEIGTPHSDELKVTERIRKVDGGKTLEDVFTFEDPIAFSKPWQAREILAWRPDIQLMEYVCEENNRNWADASGKTTAK
ncbi:MAG TPA: hypothetical protein VGM25_05510 [Caulobacteraceae bacterium]|jgi:hypothetical protein